jgi:hypothetical protein
VPSGFSTITAADTDVCLDTGVLITWAADPALWRDFDTGTRTYEVLRDGVAIATGLAYGTTTYTDTTGTPGKTYEYAVRYINGCVLSADTAGVSAAEVIGTPPSGLQAAVTAEDLDTCTETGVRITWPQDPISWGDSGSGIRTYDVLRNGTAIV